MNEKQQQLTFDKGITNVPSDALCSDNALEESMGLFYENGEHRPVQKPKEKSTIVSGYDLLYEHTYGNIDRYILKDTTNVKWVKVADSGSAVNYTTLVSVGTGGVLVTSIGKTLIISTSEGLNYLLWDDSLNNNAGGYKVLGNKIPDIRLKFSLGDDDFIDYPEKYILLTELLDGKEYTEQTVVLGYGFEFKDGQYEDAKSALIGLVASRLNNVKEKGRFSFPFWVRFAIRMYDGNHINISNPVLMLPTVRDNWWCFMSKDDGTPFDCVTGAWEKANYKPYSSKLYYNINIPSGVNLSDWTDVIRGIDIFVSEEAKNFDMEGAWEVINTCDPNDPIHGSSHPVMVDICKPIYNQIEDTPTYSPNDYSTWKTYFKPQLLSDEDIVNKLIENSRFYKILELDMEDLAVLGSVDASSKITGNALKNLTTQTMLEYDDYYGRTNIVPQVMTTYNARLHMANVTRDFFAGFNHFSYTQYSNQSTSLTYKFCTFIKSEAGDKIIKEQVSTIPEIVDIWFYYPDTRAYKVMVFDSSGNLIKVMQLKEHPRLNGAYYFKRLPSTGENYSTSSATEPTESTDKTELIEDQLIVSEINNPYIFNSKGYVQVGMGTILGIASQTTALGEEEHGIHPLIVFTERGIWTLRLNDEGIYVRSDALSREVCNNPKSIIETDGAVFFSSEKGLIVIIGTQVKCVSEQLSGKSDVPFQDYLKNAFIAYDYRDSLLWIFDGASYTVNNVSTEGSRYCYIYSIKTGTFARYDFGDSNIITSVVNKYPDYLLQSGTKVYSLIGRPNINNDGETVLGEFVFNRYSGQIVTRPMKLENALALKSIMQIRHIKQMQGTLTLSIFASNNLTNWVGLTSLRGTPWLYYKFQIDFSNMIATDRFDGTVLITQERRTDKLR